ncbi:antibiotic biosynthesis monooxygenase [Dyadobacter sp. CY345]|uniref:putative quinol monooxygenase n=1 Tax=Dyadobacter sp. CY345 TaxID=2909335 RepID=UPI001F2D8EC2|nr:antibiotic biosynthesis monooxygenase [Dyadobacter sp. CY345]MCF2444641.1 antibiotic biosynthesis monooxygenase [Dyadobacter sp. CY345]
MKNSNKGFRQIGIAASGILMMFSAEQAFSQNNNQMVRIAKIIVDPVQLEAYNGFLKEEIEESVRLEPGVLTLYAVSERTKPNHITILEIYADSAAYKSHIQTRQFLKYKNGTKDMVKSLELIESVPLLPSMKIK